MAQDLMFFAPVAIMGAIVAVVGFYFVIRERAEDKASKTRAAKQQDHSA